MPVFAAAARISPVRRGRSCATSRSALSFLDRRRLAILLGGDVVAPCDDIALVVCLLHREVGHETRRCGTVPVVLTRLEEHPVAGADHLDRPAAPLAEPHALGDPD